MTDAHKRALIVAFYLSRFDRKGFRALGYSSFQEAFGRVGEQLSVKPTTIKHMRDSFDPFCSQVRQGWHQRKILRSRANVIEAYSELSEAAMLQIVRAVLAGVDQNEVRLYTAPIANVDEELSDEDKRSSALLADDTPFATRLRTGERAESFFIEQFATLAEFSGSTLEDTRKFGTGFDFRAASPPTYRAIEVKGVTQKHGFISFTDKEWTMAQLLKEDYVLALVRSLDTTPQLDLVVNPVAYLSVAMRTIESVAVSWNARV